MQPHSAKPSSGATFTASHPISVSRPHLTEPVFGRLLIVKYCALVDLVEATFSSPLQAACRPSPIALLAVTTDGVHDPPPCRPPRHIPLSITSYDEQSTYYRPMLAQAHSCHDEELF